MKDYRAFGTELQSRRVAKGLSRPELAELSGVSAGAIEKIETFQLKNGPGRPTVIALAGALNWPTNDALDLMDEPPLAPYEPEPTPMAITQPVDLLGEVVRRWPRLPLALQAAIVALCASMDPEPVDLFADTDDVDGDSDGATVLVLEVKPDTDDVSGDDDRDGNGDRHRNGV